MRQFYSKFLILLLFLSAQSVLGQELQRLSLDSCYRMARSNYPALRQSGIIEQSKSFSLENAQKAYLPSFNILGQASYQSEVTSIPISLPNMTIEPLAKDQYRIYAELTQPLTDLLNVVDQKELISKNSLVEQQKLETELYKVKDRVNNLYFGMMLLDKQMAQSRIMKSDLKTAIDKMKVALKNGVVIQSNIDNLEAESLNVDQKILEMQSARDAYQLMLSQFIHQAIAKDVVLESPQPVNLVATISRPELALFDYQKDALSVQHKLLNAKQRPHLFAFVQGGFGRPGLNMLSNDLSPYYIGGLKLQWNLSAYYTIGKERKLLGLQQDAVEVQKDLFLFNTNLALKQERAAITQYENLMNADLAIIKLRQSIKETTAVQLENGTATTNDFITALNAEHIAQQNLLLHQIQLLKAQYNYQISTGQ